MQCEYVGVMYSVVASNPKVVCSIPAVARHVFRACPVWIYTQSNFAQACLVLLWNIGLFSISIAP
jgi:hypothetical protein